MESEMKKEEFTKEETVTGEIAIEVNNVEKIFKVYYDRGNLLKEKIIFRKRNKYEERRVLDDISFNIKKGEAVGLIGQNGCGKSTTLKLLTKIIFPNSGSINMHGRVSSLLELGAGFHPDMSGRENIYTNAAIFGLTKKEIDNKLEEIIEFSELEDYIDNPVRTYSSGMYMRLAFSVSINVGADILLIDEILAVGDANFQAKCFNKLREIKGQGVTIVIVSHSMGQLEQICDRSIWLEKGKIVMDGLPREVHPAYLDYMGKKRQKQIDAQKQKQQEKTKETKEEKVKEEKSKREKRFGNGHARMTDIRLLNNTGKEQGVFSTGADITLEILYEVKQPVVDAVFGIAVYRMDKTHCYGTNTRIDKLDRYSLTKDGKTLIKLKNVNLLAGKYTLDIAIEAGMGDPVDYYKEACSFEMYSDIQDVGLVRLNHEWEIEEIDI